MDASELTLIGGLLLGLASSLHCAGMCGAVASTIMFAFSGEESVGKRLEVLLLAQAGKATAYVTAGAAVGLAGSSVYGLFDQALAYRLLQWGAAVTLAWIGLTLTGLAPSLALIDRVTRPITLRIGRAAPALAGYAGPASFASGLAWGFLPCGMVYGGLFYAMLTGSAAGGAGVMAGFALGTMPSVTAAALGIGGLRGLARKPRLRIAMGGALIAVAAATLYAPAGGWMAYCIDAIG